MGFRESDRIVISGAGGMVGRELAAQARSRGRDVLALTSSDWDITDAPAAERFIESGD
ncbi:MAG: sugar nucleotide-binding protein, partial [Mycobacterium sp.]